MANIAATVTDLPGIHHPSLLDTTASTLKESLSKLSGGLSMRLAQGAESQGRGEASRLALGERMSVDLQTLNQATINANDGIAMTQVAGAGLEDIHADIQELKRLVVASLNGALSEEDRAALQEQVKRIQQAIEQKVQTTRYNGVSLLAATKTIALQTGMDNATQITIALKDFSNAFTPLDLTSHTGAGAAMLSLQKEEQMIEAAQSHFAAQELDLSRAIDLLDSWSLSLSGSGGHLESPDSAQAAAGRVAAQIRSYANMAFQVQANQSAARVQHLL